MTTVQQKQVIETGSTLSSPIALTKNQQKVLDTALKSFKSNEPNWDNLKPITLNKGQEQLPECQMLIRTVYETVLGEITQKLEHVETGIKWLISVDPEHASFYNGVLARFLFSQNKLEECVQVLKGQISKIKEKDEGAIKKYSDNKEYSKLIEIYQKYLPEESCVNPNEQRRYEKDMLAIVSLILPTQKDEKIENLENLPQIELTKEQINELENFLAYSLGNVDLNQRLHLKANKTPAENFIWSLSHITSAEVSGTIGIKTLLQSVQNIKEKLADCNASALEASHQEIKYLEIDLLKMFTEKDKETFTKILSSPGKNIWEVRNSEEYIQFFAQRDSSNKSLDDLEEAIDSSEKKVLAILPKESKKQFDQMYDSIYKNLEKKSDAQEEPTILARDIRKNEQYLNFFKSLKPKNQDNKKLIDDLIQKTILFEVKALNQELANTKKLEQSAKIKGEKLHYSSLKQLEIFDSIKPNLDKIARRCGDFKNNPILHEIYGGCTAAAETLDQLKTIMKSSSSFLAGDVLIRDEKRYKKFSGGKRTVYSEVSLWMNIKGAFQMAKDAITKGVWSVQPYFTGSRMHARVVYNNSEDIVDPDTKNILAKVKTPLAADITIQGYDEAEISPGSTMEEVALRPDFKKILSDKGRALLKDKKPSPEEYVRRIFAEKLSNDIETKQTTNKELTLDEMRGFRAFALSKVHSKIKWIINALFGESGIVRPLINTVVNGARGKKETEDMVVKEENKRICSEFVSETLRNALEETQAQLRNDLNDQSLTFFNDVFPSKIDLPSEEIHPDYLEQLLIKQGYFTEIKRPPILQQIFKGVEEDIGTTKSA